MVNGSWTRMNELWLIFSLNINEQLECEKKWFEYEWRLYNMP